MADKSTTVKKTVNGYNYKYADLAAIHEELERQGITYYQYTEYCPEAEFDYVYTVIKYSDGKESKPLRGCRVLYGDGKMKSLAQEQGSGLTYARRYSLLMALGWASEDDDGATAGRPAQAPAKNKVDFRAIREQLGEMTSVDELNAFWQSLHLSEAQANILKKDFADRKAKLGAGE